jgi:sugar-specific transcriptional regulator TrmB
MDASPNVERMVRLGLTTYEARAYTTLVRRDSFTAAQVSRQAGLPRQRIYDVLGSLVQKGLASSRPGHVVKYAAVSPEQAIARLVALRRSELQDLERDAAELVARLTPEYVSGQAHTDPLEFIEVLRDRGAINERFEEIQANVQKEILVFTKPPYATPPQENPVGIEVTKSHSARSVYEMSILEDPATAAGVRRFIDAGEEARFADHVPLKLVIIDESIVMFGMVDPVAGAGAANDLTMMVVEHPALAHTLKLAFDAVWDAGLTFEQATDVLAERHRQSA